MIRGPKPLPVITISGARGSDGSLLVAVTLNDESPNLSVAVTVATSTSLWSGGQRMQPDDGSPEITLSITRVAVPLSGKWCGLPGAVSKIVICAALLPMVVGLKLVVRTQLG